MIVPAEATSLVNNTALDIAISPIDETYTPNMGFTWETISFTSREIQIQMSFEKPNYISQSVYGLDTLKIKVKEPELFVSSTSF